MNTRLDMNPVAAQRTSGSRIAAPGKAVLVACGLLMPAGCQQKMGRQPAYRPLEPSSFFPDGRSARPLVPGTVARGQLRTDTTLYEGKQKGDYTTDFPFEMTKEVLQRGRQRFDIFCSVCHGL